MLNMAGMYRPTPEDVAKTRTRQPPRHGPSDRPRVAAAPQPDDGQHVDDREHDGGRAEDQVEAPVEQQARHGRRSGEVIADLDGGYRRIEDGRRRRRSTAQRHRDTERQPEDNRFDEPEPDQRCAGFGI
jgi:hypothetical protein